MKLNGLIKMGKKYKNNILKITIKFIGGLYNFLPNFTYESSKKRVAFLDLNASLENGSVTTDLHTKSTDCHQYPHCSSSHPDHIKNSIVKL